MSPGPEKRRAVGHWILPLRLAGAAACAYHNSFAGPFILDDVPHIADNPRIRTLWPIWEEMAQLRPIVNLTLAVNYAIGELDVRGYHAFNLLIHVLTAVTLFGIMRRTFHTPRFRDRYGSVAP